MMSETARNLSEMGVERFTATMQDKRIKGIPGYSTKELTNESFCITKPLFDMHKVFLLPNQKTPEIKQWCDNEFAERISISHINPGEAYKHRPEMWEQFLNRNEGRFAYTYNERIRPQLTRIIETLKDDISSRQCILSIWNPTIDVPKLGIDRVPCSLYYHFLATPRISDKPEGDMELNMIYAMRSCDFVNHMANDVYLAIRLMKWVCGRLFVKSGKFFMNISSLHYYQKDEELLDEYMKSAIL